MAACSRRKRERRTDHREYQQSNSKSDELFSFDIGLIYSPCKGWTKCEHEVVGDLSPAPIATAQQRIERGGNSEYFSSAAKLAWLVATLFALSCLSARRCPLWGMERRTRSEHISSA